MNINKFLYLSEALRIEYFFSVFLRKDKFNAVAESFEPIMSNELYTEKTLDHLMTLIGNFE